MITITNLGDSSYLISFCTLNRKEIEKASWDQPTDSELWPTIWSDGELSVKLNSIRTLGPQLDGSLVVVIMANGPAGRSKIIIIEIQPRVSNRLVHLRLATKRGLLYDQQERLGWRAGQLHSCRAFVSLESRTRNDASNLW